MSNIAKTPSPPYYAVIFTSKRKEGDFGYEQMSKKMVESVLKQDGFLGFESARDEVGITVSYWRDMESIKRWKDEMEHQKAQELGKSIWYKRYRIRVAKVEKEYGFEAK